jgi:hypothetical protein
VATKISEPISTDVAHFLPPLKDLVNRYGDHPPKHLQLLVANKNARVIERNASWEDMYQQN